MKLKSYLRGLGTGLFISAVLMGIAVSGKDKELTDTEIKTRAKALGMVEEDSVLVKPAEDTGSQDAADESAANKPEDKTPVTEVKEEIKPEEAAEDKTEEKTENKTEEKSENKQEVKEEEKTEDKTGVKPEQGRKDTGVAVLEEDPEPAEETTAGEESTDGDDIRDSKEDRAMGGQNEKKSSNEKVSGLQNSSKELGYNEYFTIQIAKGSSSETVSGLLKRGGAVDNADDFDEFLCKNHYDKKITPGVFKIPVGADYEQIANIITGGE